VRVCCLQRVTQQATNIPDQCVYTISLDIVQSLDSLLDLVLVGTKIDNEDKGVVVLNLLHGALGGQGVAQDLELVKTSWAWDRSSGILWLASKSQGLWAEEVDVCADLLGDLGVDALLDSLGCGGSLGYWLVICTTNNINSTTGEHT
jgi:hypothetical protein